jgi:type IV fimbrial biogenesis protein FimT
MEMHENSSGNKGLTVIELLITIAVAAILLSVAVPSLQTFTANNQIFAAQASIVEGLNLARFTAVTSGEEVAICPSANESACSDDNWDKGWIVFDNSDGNEIPADAERLRVSTLTGGLSDSANGQMVVFESDGTTTLSSAVTITICHMDTDVTDQCRQVSVTPFGVISSSKTTATS